MAVSASHHPSTEQQHTAQAVVAVVHTRLVVPLVLVVLAVAVTVVQAVRQEQRTLVAVAVQLTQQVKQAVLG
jgi:hypothetical protein